MNQSITILEAVLIAIACVMGYAFIKTLVETFKTPNNGK